MQGKIFVKQSLSDAYRQYLEDVTIPMNTYLDAPEEFVTTKPSIYHSLRLQPVASLDTGKIRLPPTRARFLPTDENRGFQDDLRDYSLPLFTNQGEPLYGRHVYPGELFSFNPTFKDEKKTPDLIPTNLTSHSSGENAQPLKGDKAYRRQNLFGFTGNAPTPQRFTSSTLQPEGIIYGNLDENDVVQINTKPTSAYQLMHVARALSPFHPTMDIKNLNENEQLIARDIMDAGIPPILAESNVDTRGRTHHLPFRLDEPIDVKEAHDPFAQYDMGNLNRPSPEGLEQFTLDSIRTGEPMDIAMQFLKQEKSREQMINEDLFLDYLGEKDLLHYDEMNDKQRAIIDAKAALPSHLFTEGTEMGENMNLYLFSRSMHENIPEHHYDDELEYLQHYNDALQPFLNNREKTNEVDGDGLQNHPEHPHNVAISRMHPNFKDRLKLISRLYSPNFQASEPMELAMQLLKERVSPEAKRHKLEYDKKYESSPERVKYREELNRERRRRHIMGQGGPDMSHTARGTIVPESPHTNRARHFKDKGTLL